MDFPNLMPGGALIGVLAMIVIAVIATFLGRMSGAAKEREKQAEERLQARTEADRIDDAIAGRSDDENRARLKRWGK
jgi:hypothetical protein